MFVHLRLQLTICLGWTPKDWHVFVTQLVCIDKIINSFQIISSNILFVHMICSIHHLEIHSFSMKCISIAHIYIYIYVFLKKHPIFSKLWRTHPKNWNQKSYDLPTSWILNRRFGPPTWAWPERQATNSGTVSQAVVPWRNHPTFGEKNDQIINKIIRLVFHLNHLYTFLGHHSDISYSLKHCLASHTDRISYLGVERLSLWDQDATFAQKSIIKPQETWMVFSGCIVLQQNLQ